MHTHKNEDTNEKTRQTKHFHFIVHQTGWHEWKLPFAGKKIESGRVAQKINLQCLSKAQQQQQRKKQVQTNME